MQHSTTRNTAPVGPDSSLVTRIRARAAIPAVRLMGAIVAVALVAGSALVACSSTDEDDHGAGERQVLFEQRLALF